MKNTIVNTREVSLYFDGKDFYSGNVKENKYDERVFVNEEECFGVWLKDENTNQQLKQLYPSVIILNELIADDLCDEVNKYKLMDTIGFDESESDFIVKLYNKGEMDYLSFKECIINLGAKVSSRIKSKDNENQFNNCVKKFFGEPELEIE